MKARKNRKSISPAGADEIAEQLEHIADMPLPFFGTPSGGDWHSGYADAAANFRRLLRGAALLRRRTNSENSDK